MCFWVFIIHATTKCTVIVLQSQGFYYCDSIPKPKTTCVRKGLFQLIILRSQSLREAREGTQSRNLDVGSEEEVMGECYVLACSSWLAQTASLWTNHQPGGGTAISHQSSFKKIHNRPILWRHFLSWVSLFPDNSSLCHTDIKLTNTVILSPQVMSFWWPPMPSCSSWR